jgi:beta-lactamase superfamily II metal-dependent hydrolase
MRGPLVHVPALALFAGLVIGQSQTAKTLDIYLIDVEGGNAQLYRLPSGESVLIDSGNGGAAAARDATRIMAAVKDAGLRQIDHLITTHFHDDHVGGLPELAMHLSIREFIDHGPNVQPGPQIDPVLARYAQLYSSVRHRVVTPGDKLAVNDVDWRIVSAGGHVIKRSLPGGGQSNPYCRTFTSHEVNPVSGAPVGNTEDEQSVGSHVTFGKFRLLYLGDFTWNQEFDLACPANRLGKVDLLVASRHGQPSSNSEALVHAVQPRVILMNNGPRKGGQPQAMKILLSSPRLENLWAIHFSELGGQEYTVPGMLIANAFDEPRAAMPVAPMVLPARGGDVPPAPTHNGMAYWIKVSARSDGSFTITNGRNAFSKTYPPKQGASR